MQKIQINSTGNLDVSFSPKERIFIYQKAIERLDFFSQNDEPPCLCWALTHAIDPDCIWLPDNIIQLFPEITPFEVPENERHDFRSAYWFPLDAEGLEKRKEILDSAIKLLQAHTSNYSQ